MKVLANIHIHRHIYVAQECVRKKVWYFAAQRYRDTQYRTELIIGCSELIIMFLWIFPVMVASHILPLHVFIGYHHSALWSIVSIDRL